MNRKIKFICDNSTIEESKDPRYHSCYREIFVNGKGRDIYSIKTDGCTGSTLDPRLPNAFKDLIIYDISNHGLECLTPADFRFNNIYSLEALHNKLTFIPAGLFVHAPILAYVDFSNNNITALEAGAFSELSNLFWLGLNDNPIRHFDGKIFLPIHFQTDTFSLSWENVEAFDISNMDGVFDFSYRLELFEGLAFEKSKKIPYGRSTKYYKKDYFKNVKVFNASGTPIADVVGLFGIFGPSIEVLDVSSSSIAQLNESVFDQLSNLHHLNLSNTSLTSLDFDEIRNRAELTVLDVSLNSLHKINYSPGIGSCEKLETLNLIGNKLTEIDFVTPANFPKLMSLGISQNLFTCDFLKAFLKQWSDLQLFETDSANQKHEQGIDCN